MCELCIRQWSLLAPNQLYVVVNDQMKADERIESVVVCMRVFLSVSLQ